MAANHKSSAASMSPPYRHAVLSPTLATWRLGLHVLAAAVWVGGQIVLGGLMPSLHRAAPDATGVVARAYARIAWPALRCWC